MHRRTLLLLLLLLVVARGLLVVSIADVFFHDEEGAKGAAAKALIDGLGVPRWQLNYGYHEGGGFLVSHLSSLFFRAMGPSILAMKLTAILTTSLLLVVGVRFAEESFGSKAAALFGLLFVFCPQTYLRYSLLALGTHFESLIPIALVLHFGARALFRPDPPLRDWALLGACSGLGIYVSLQTAAAIAAIAIALLVKRRVRLVGRQLAVSVLGFAVGALPLWWTMSHVGTAALRVRSYRPLPQGLRGWSALREILRPLVDEPDLWAWTRTVAAAVAILAALWLARGDAGARLRQRCGLIGLYLAVYLALYVGSGYAMPNQGHWGFWTRLAPLWLFGSVLLAGSAAYLIEQVRGRGRELALGAIALTLVAGVADLVGLLRRALPSTPLENLRLLSATKGYDLVEYFDKLVHHLDGSLSDRYAVLARFEDDPELLLPSAMHSLLEHSGCSLEEAVRFARDHAGSEWRTALLGLGLEAAPPYGHDLAGAFARLESAPADTREPLAEAVGRIALGLLRTPEKIDQQARTEVPVDLRAAFLRGAGWRIHRMYPLRADLAQRLVERQPAEAQGAIWEGYLRARAAHTIR